MISTSQENKIEAGILYTKEINFIEYFGKTLEESYDLDLGSGILEVTERDIVAIINIYDRKNSSPEIKSAVKLLVNLLHLKEPLKLNDPLLLSAMDIV